MSFMNFNLHTWELFWGNILLMVCCLFYLAWWIVAFHPNTPSKGLQTGLLLAAATAAGIAAVVLTVKGMRAIPHEAKLFPTNSILWGGIAAYFVLLAVTSLFFKRQVTTELILIVGWAMMEMSEIDALYGAGRFGLKAAVILSVVIGFAAVISLICYVLYYRLELTAGYIDGMVPLIILPLVMAGISVTMAVL